MNATCDWLASIWLVSRVGGGGMLWSEALYNISPLVGIIHDGVGTFYSLFVLVLFALCS